MPILANTQCNDPAQIRAAFLPFARPDYVQGMIIGDDLDSLLSAMWLHQRFGWPVAGVYCCYTRIWHAKSQEDFWGQLLSGRLFAVDLDICHPNVPSLGHHIISLRKGEDLPGHSHTLNPNALRGFSVHENFNRKYPLATIHFLRWLFQEKTWSPGAEMLAWLADSSFVNAQHYTKNVAEWVGGFLGFSAFAEILPTLQTLDFERTLAEKILRPMSANALCHRGRSSYKSKHLGLNGFQCQFDDPSAQNTDLQSLLANLSELSGWQKLLFPRQFEGCIEGQRLEMRIAEAMLPKETVAAWLERKEIFSYAFTFKERVNFTIF
jgi:hypothetical protein